jgi:hypothetical protein
MRTPGGCSVKLHEGYTDRFAWISEGCKRLMKTGGGSLPQSKKQYKHLTEAQRAEAARLYTVEKMTQAAIGRHFGVGQNHVSQVLRKLGIMGRVASQQKTIENKRRLRVLMRHNSMMECADILGLSYNRTLELRAEIRRERERKHAA